MNLNDQNFRLAAVILNSPLPDSSTLARALKPASLIVAADGGANRAAECGISPHVVIGDLDSATHNTLNQLARCRCVRRPSQAHSDLEKALDFLIEEKYQAANILGASGGRLDHQLVNLSIAQKYCAALRLTLYDDYGLGFFLNAADKEAVLTLDLEKGQKLSLVSFCGAQRIRTSGLKFPLSDESLQCGVRDGLSNEVLDGTVSISVGCGILFVYIVNRSAVLPC